MTAPEHDPLCRRAKIMESLMEGCPECSLIDRVRADERERAAERVEELPTYWSVTVNRIRALAAIRTP